MVVRQGERTKMKCIACKVELDIHNTIDFEACLYKASLPTKTKIGLKFSKTLPVGSKRIRIPRVSHLTEPK